MNKPALKTTVTNPDIHPRYTDQSYPGNQFVNSYYEVSYSGVARQHDKYMALKRALLDSIEYCLTEASPLSPDIRELKSWVFSGSGFTRAHMPWKVLLPAELYKVFAYVLTKRDTPASRAAYHSMRRYGKWV